MEMVNKNQSLRGSNTTLRSPRTTQNPTCAHHGLISSGLCSIRRNSSSASSSQNHFTAMKELLLKSDDFSRRQFVEQAAKAFLGVSALPLCMKQAQAAGRLGSETVPQNRPLARNIIYLYMSGGMTHLIPLTPSQAPSRRTSQSHQDQGRWRANLRVSPLAGGTDGQRLCHPLPLLNKGCTRARSVLHAHQLCQESDHRTPLYGRMDHSLSRQIQHNPTRKCRRWRWQPVRRKRLLRFSAYASNDRQPRSRFAKQ